MENNLRSLTNKVKIKDKVLGGSNQVLIQTMSKTKTSLIDENIALADDLYKRGCDLLRLSVLDEEDAKALAAIVDQSKMPIIADIHFSKNLAIKAIESGVAKIRINPGNMKIDDLKEVIHVAKIYNVAIRIGINSGCLDTYRSKDPKAMNSYFSLLDQTINIFKENDYDQNLVLALKSTDPELTYNLYRSAANIYKYPLHLGVTETGYGIMGMARTCSALVPLLKEGIGNTIRITLTDSPQEEVEACKSLLTSLGLRKEFPTLISCPTCGRTKVDVSLLVRKVQDLIAHERGDFKVAIMGCPVNGPGEAKNADIGLAGLNDSFMIFEKGEQGPILKEEKAFTYLKKKIAILSKRSHIVK